MNEKAAREIAEQRLGSQKEDDLVVKRLARTFPEPGSWLTYDDDRLGVRRGAMLVERSLFVAWQDDTELVFGRAVVTEDPSDTMISFRDGPVNSLGGWQRAWHVDFRSKPRDFPALELTTYLTLGEEPEHDQAFVRDLAKLAGWEI
jgi:hypothetical protein